MVNLSNLNQTRLSGRSIAAKFISDELSKYSENESVSEINFNLSGIKSINQSFLNEMIQRSLERFPDAHLYPSNAESSDLSIRFDSELKRIKSISNKKSS